MDDYRRELSEVKNELLQVEGEIERLLQRQAVLLEKKKDIETILTQSTSKSRDDKKWDRTDFPWSKEMRTTMESVFRMKNLRPMQLETMNLTMSNKDCILIMPTGGGKSLCFQLPALVSKGITLVVSPLVSLMEDQVFALKDFGVEAAMLNAACDKETVKRVQDAMIDKKATLKLVYVTPEKLAKSKRFMARLEKTYQLGRFCRLVIDEVHCCSQWGHDFRPDYKFLGIMKRQFPEVPILGLTATATLKVLDDVKKILNIPNCYLFRASFNRANLYYEVRAKPASQADTMNDMKLLITNQFKDQSGIVYCLTRKDSEDVTVALQQRGVKAGCYHADLSARERSRVHHHWLTNKIMVVVATVAFGMGIDKPDVRFVIHHSLSKSMENLYQESGRAGRDEGRSHCILYYRFADVFRLSTMVFTEQTGLDNLYGIVRYCTDVKRCRRSMIARHFGEVWEQSQCNRMCDHCDTQTPGSEKRDVTKHCQNVLKILDLAKSTEQKLTSLKLIDTWTGKGVPTLRIKGSEAPSISREKLERIIAHMLLEGYIEESFHFTPYSTISYLVPGSKARHLNFSMTTVSMEFLAKHKPITASNPLSNTPSRTSSSATSSSVTSSNLSSTGEKLSPEKPKLCVINRQNSAFSPFVLTADIDTTALAASKKSHSDKSDGQKPSGKKRTKKRAVIESDDDSDSLDFGDFDLSSPKKRMLPHKNVSCKLDSTEKQKISNSTEKQKTSNSTEKQKTSNSVAKTKNSKTGEVVTGMNGLSPESPSCVEPIHIDSDSDAG